MCIAGYFRKFSFKETIVQVDRTNQGLCNDVCSLDINPQNDIVEVIILGKNPQEKAPVGNPRSLKVATMKNKMINYGN